MTTTIQKSSSLDYHGNYIFQVINAMKYEYLRSHWILESIIRYDFVYKNLKYTQLTPVFRLHNIHLEFSTCPSNSNGHCVPKPQLNTQDLKTFNIQI